MTRNIVGVATLLALLGAATAALHGQEASRPETFVDLANGTSVQELTEMALQRNAAYLAVRQKLDEAQGLRVQAGQRPNPSLDVNVTNGAVLGSPGERDFGLGYSHTLELGGKRARRLEAAGVAEALAEAEIRERERQLRAEIGRGFAEALAAQRNFEITDSLLRLNRHSLEIAEARYRQGEAARLEPGILRVEVGRIEADRVLFENQTRQAVENLKLLAGIDAATPLRLKGALTAARIGMAEAEALETALRQRPDLQAAAHEQALGESEIRLARAAAVPDLTASGGYTRSNSRFDQFGLSGPGGGIESIRATDNTLSVGLSMELPLRNRNRGNIQAAIARRRAAQLRRDYLENTVRRDVRNAYGRYEAAMRAARIFDADVLKQAEENVSILRAAYDAGELRLLDVINEQRGLIETQKAYTEVLREAYLSLADLERAVGAPVR